MIHVPERSVSTTRYIAQIAALLRLWLFRGTRGLTDAACFYSEHPVSPFPQPVLGYLTLASIHPLMNVIEAQFKTTVQWTGPKLWRAKEKEKDFLEKLRKNPP